MTSTRPEGPRGGASRESLPFVTRVTISNAFPVAMALLGGATLAVAFTQRSVRVRRVLLLVVFCTAGLTAIATLIGWYLPIFSIADAVKAE